MVREIQKLIEDDEDSYDREAAERAEDMALSCRTMAGIYQRRPTVTARRKAATDTRHRRKGAIT
ncbi:hypothetical protein ACWC0C_42100 [Streptomyces sp. NPDC001709]